MEEYIYTDIRRFCCDYILAPMGTISRFDYLGGIRIMNDYYQDEYHRRLLDKYQKHKFDKPLLIDDIDSDLDNIGLQYTKCFDNLSLLIVWPISQITDIYQSKFYHKLIQEGQVHIIKKLKLSLEQIIGIIYQVYYNIPAFKRYAAIVDKANKIYLTNTPTWIIIYEPYSLERISGSEAEFKVELREILQNESKHPKLKKNLFLHVTDNITEVYELAELFFNSNSLDILNLQKTNRLMYYQFEESIIMLMTYKNWLYQNIDLIDQTRFLLFSSVVLYSLGLRPMHDLDLFVYNLPLKAQTKEFESKMDMLIDQYGKGLPFLEMLMKERGDWCRGCKKEYLYDWFDREWPNLYGSSSLTETITNPQFHYYFLGVKIISLQADIVRRISRSRAAAYADLIALNLLINKLVIEIPEVPEGYWEANKYHKYDKRTYMKMLKTVKYYLKKRYMIYLNVDEIKKVIHMKIPKPT